MPGYTDKSRRYLRLADEQIHRAEAALGPRARSMFLALAQRYREMAGQIDDPAQWRVRALAVALDKPKNGGDRMRRAD
jgi:hypothetical protein